MSLLATVAADTILPFGINNLRNLLTDLKWILPAGKRADVKLNVKEII